MFHICRPLFISIWCWHMYTCVYTHNCKHTISILNCHFGSEDLFFILQCFSAFTRVHGIPQTNTVFHRCSLVRSVLCCNVGIHHELNIFLQIWLLHARACAFQNLLVVCVSYAIQMPSEFQVVWNCFNCYGQGKSTLISPIPVIRGCWTITYQRSHVKHNKIV